MNRTRRKALKMARKQGRGIFAPSRYSHWSRRGVEGPPLNYEALAVSMRAAYLSCSSSDRPPTAVYLAGSELNRLTGSTAYDTTGLYLVQQDGITAVE